MKAQLGEKTSNGKREKAKGHEQGKRRAFFRSSVSIHGTITYLIIVGAIQVLSKIVLARRVFFSMRVKMNIFDYFGPKLVCLLEYFGVEGALDKRYNTELITCSLLVNVDCYQIQ